MGIRFACHACGKHLNIKNELAGRRGICPSCSGRFRIPMQDAERSTPVQDAKRAAPEANATAGNPTTANPSVGGITTGGAATGGVPAAGVSADDGLPDAATGDAPVADHNAAASQLSSLDLLTSDPTSTWYVRPPTGGQYGPATGEVLREWIAEGRVATTALLWREGWPQWREATEALPELATRLPDPNANFANNDNQSDNQRANQTNGVVAANNAVEKNTSAALAVKSTDSWSPAIHDPMVQSALSTNDRVVQPSAAMAAKERAAIDGDEFGYDDSVFANSGNSYSTSTTSSSTTSSSATSGSASTDSLAASVTGRSDVGKTRRARATRRTAFIVLLGVFSMVFIGALIYVTTR